MVLLIQFLVSGTNAQSIDNTRDSLNFVVVNNAKIIQDSFTIIPQSVVITNKKGQKINSSNYSVDNAKIFLNKGTYEKYQSDTLFYFYRKLRVNLGRSYFHLDSIALQKSENDVYIDYDIAKPKKSKNGLLPSSLDYDGSFARGFSIGNRQNLSLNSSLNMQMAGEIGNGIRLKAAISDDNIPIQPEGTTQRLNEFDKVFIEIGKGAHTLVAGDYEISSSGGYFSKYFKKLKGVNYRNTFDFSGKKLNNNVSFAISKGKFSRNELKVINGNQGPYKLIGNTGENYLIILSGTEKVYLDGKLLKRGLDFDYTIDYNTAELTFRNVAINENSRVIVEFEYSDQNYLRSLQVFNTTFGDSTKNIYFNFYNEMDSKKSLGLIELSDEDIEKLEQSGDNIQDSRRSGIISKEENEKLQVQIFYKKIKIAGVADSILVYSSEPDSAKYIAYFTDFGEYNGSYVLDKELSANAGGPVYRWVGEGLGRYDPEIQLVPPELRQMYSLGANYKIGKHTDLNMELGMSNIDKNRFSSIDNDDNIGLAGFFQFNTGKEYKIDSTSSVLLKNSTNYEFSASNFSPLNPYRAPEFRRDWNLNDKIANSDEHLIRNTLYLRYKITKLEYTYSGFFKPKQFTGNKNKLGLNLNYRGLRIDAVGDVLFTEDKVENTVFLRPKVDISQRIKLGKETRIGFYFENENNSINAIDSDSLSSRSFKFDYYKVYLSSRSSGNFGINVFTGYRRDYLPKSNEFTPFTDALEVGAQGNWGIGKVSNLVYNLSYRELSIINPLSDSRKPESNILGKINHVLNISNGGIKSSSNIEFNSGQIVKPIVVFIKDEQGSYIKIEDSTNVSEVGKYQLFTGVTDKQRYRRFTLYNNEFERVNSTTISNSLSISADKFFEDPKSIIARQIAKLSLISRFRFSQKVRLKDGGFPLSIVTDLSDTTIVLHNYNIVSTMFYNRGNPDYDIRLGYRSSSGLTSQLNNVKVLNTFREYNTAIRFSYGSFIDLISRFSLGNKKYDYEVNSKGNYDNDFISLSQEVNFIFSQKFGLKLNYNFSDKKNKLGQKEHATIHTVKAASKILALKKTSINLSLSYVNILFSGSSSNLIKYAMLENLKEGNNFLWEVNINKRIRNNLNIILNYEARKSEGSALVHQAKMQARATF